MARRVFMHVGTPKSGTTFLQSVWWTNTEALLEQDLLLPGDGVHEHYWASCEVRGEQQVAHLPPRGRGAWERILAEVERHRGDALLSHELFSPAPEPRAGAALARLAEVAEEVHVVVTARDLARQIPAEWQQRVKHGRPQTFVDFLHMIRTNESVNFWQVQDVPAVLDRWSRGVQPEHVHIVVLPPPGGPRTFLWDRMCALTGVDGTGMAERTTRSNESLGLVEAETLRRVADALRRDGMAKSTERLLKDFVAEKIFRSPDPERIVVPAAHHDWVVARSTRMVDELRTRPYDVIGDLDHLVPSSGPQAGRLPVEVTDAEVAATAVAALARFVSHEEKARRRRSSPPDGTGSAPGFGARLRRRLSSVRPRAQR